MFVSCVIFVELNTNLSAHSTHLNNLEWYVSKHVGHVIVPASGSANIDFKNYAGQGFLLASHYGGLWHIYVWSGSLAITTLVDYPNTTITSSGHILTITNHHTNARYFTLH